MDVINALIIAVPITAFMTLLVATCIASTRIKEAYVHGYNTGHIEGYQQAKEVYEGLDDICICSFKEEGAE